MAKFNYSDYQDVVTKAQNGSASSVKVGFFKLKNDGDEALVRINCATVNDLQFATVHTVQVDGKWMRVSCLNPVGSYSDTCPLCTAAQAGSSTISKASKKVYVQMLVSYKDPTTNTFSAAIPVIWERPAGFSRELANKLRDFGSLKEHVFKVVRNGAAGDMKTTYSLDYVPVYDKPELVSSDFSAFANFNIARHSYWEKSIAEIETFLNTGKFPEVATSQATASATTVAQVAAAQSVATASQAQTTTAASQSTVVEETKTEEVQPVTRPTRQWSF